MGMMRQLAKDEIAELLGTELGGQAQGWLQRKGQQKGQQKGPEEGPARDGPDRSWPRRRQGQCASSATSIVVSGSVAACRKKATRNSLPWHRPNEQRRAKNPYSKATTTLRTLGLCSRFD